MEHETRIINLFGGAGIGKSTTAAKIFSILKDIGINAELVSEFAKDCVWEDRTATLDDELYIFAKQNHRIKRLLGKVEYIVTDAPILLKLMYMGDEPESLKHLVLDTHNSHEMVNVLLSRSKPYNPKGRIQTLDQAKEKDVEIKSILEEHTQYEVLDNFDYESLTNWVKDIVYGI